MSVGSIRPLFVGAMVVAALGGCDASDAPPIGTVTQTRDGDGVTTGTVQHDGQLDRDRPAYETWEEAAVAEAKRLSAALVAPVAKKVRLGAPATFERVQVTGVGYCHVFGGSYVRGEGWRANDLGRC